MKTNRYFNLKKDDSYLSKLTHDTIIFGENLYKIISKTFVDKKDETVNEHKNDDNSSISFCSEALPFFCKSEVIHQKNIFNIRYGHSCIFYNNSIYIYGGNQQISNINKNLIQYSIDNQAFKNLEEINPPKLRYFSTLNLIYSSEFNEQCFLLYGGKEDSYITNDTYIFNISKKTWKCVDTKHYPPPVFGHVSFNYKNIVFIHGGNMGNSKMNRDIWCYFEKEQKWFKVMSKKEYYNKDTDKPCGRYFHSCSVCISNQGNDIKAYIFGGLNSDHKCVEDVFWSYSVNNGKWMHIKNHLGEMPIGRYGHSSMVLNGRWFLIYGGYNLLWYKKSLLLDIYAYDTKLNVWSSLNVYGMSPSTHHFYGNIVQVDESGYFFIFGGLRDNNSCCNIYKYTPLFASHYFKVLYNRLKEINKKVESFETKKYMVLNPTFKQDLIEIKKVISSISFTFSRYIQLVNDLNEKIKISNMLANKNYSYLLKKFESHEKRYEDLIKRIQALDNNNPSDISLCNIKESLEETDEENILKLKSSNSSISSQENNDINYESLIYDGINNNVKE